MATDADGNFFFDGGSYDPASTDNSAASDGNAGEAAAQSAYQANPQSFTDPSSYAANAIALAGSSGAIDPSGSLASWGSENRDAPTRGMTQETATKDDNQPSMVEKAWGYLNSKDAARNPLLMMALAGIASHGNNEFKREQAATQEQYAKDRIAANSASVANLRPTQGIIQSVLKRVGGNQVFNPNGQVAR